MVQAKIMKKNHEDEVKFLARNILGYLSAEEEEIVNNLDKLDRLGNEDRFRCEETADYRCVEECMKNGKVSK